MKDEIKENVIRQLTMIPRKKLEIVLKSGRMDARSKGMLQGG